MVAATDAMPGSSAEAATGSGSGAAETTTGATFTALPSGAGDTSDGGEALEWFHIKILLETHEWKASISLSIQMISIR